MKAALFTAACWAVILCSAGNPVNQDRIDATPSAPPDDIISAKIAEIGISNKKGAISESFTRK